jgi:hypothetical protein
MPATAAAISLAVPAPIRGSMLAPVEGTLVMVLE